MNDNRKENLLALYYWLWARTVWAGGSVLTNPHRHAIFRGASQVECSMDKEIPKMVRWNGSFAALPIFGKEIEDIQQKLIF
jgi:hypothetical protein